MGKHFQHVDDTEARLVKSMVAQKIPWSMVQKVTGLYVFFCLLLLFFAFLALFQGIHSARTVPVQCPYSARTVPTKKNHSAHQFIKAKEKHCVIDL